MGFLVKAVAATAFGIAAQTASAAVFTYELSDNGTGELSEFGYSYGLRLDSYIGMDVPEVAPVLPVYQDGEGGNDPVEYDDDSRMVFSFDAGDATLTYDDVAGTVLIKGTMVRSLANNMLGKVWEVVYTMTGVTNAGYGMFISENDSGSGSISNGDNNFALGAKDRDGEYFLLTDTSDRYDNTPGVIVGEGWVNTRSADCCDDFLFNAELVEVSAVPLPAAGWMLIAAVGGMGAMSRRKKRS